MCKKIKMYELLAMSPGDGVFLTSVRIGLIIPTTRAFAAVELLLCVRIMAQEVFSP